MNQAVTIKLADESDFERIVSIGDELFDHAVKPHRLTEFLQDSRHTLALALLGDNIVGMASGFYYIHPDKDTQLFVNEVAVLEDHQRQGIGRALVMHLLDQARQAGCREAWIATEASNTPARKAFVAAGGKEAPYAVSLITYELQDQNE